MGVGRAALLKNGDTFIFRKKETHGVGHGFHRKLRLIANTEGDLFFVEIGDRLDRGSGRGGDYDPFTRRQPTPYPSANRNSPQTAPAQNTQIAAPSAKDQQFAQAIRLGGSLAWVGKS